jgi:mRNA interferase MazF
MIVCSRLLSPTQQARGSGFEVAVPARFLKPGVFDAQNLISIPHAKLVRRLGVLTPDQMDAVSLVVRKWLGL